MFLIRPEQRDRLAAISAERFTNEMMSHVRRYYSVETAGYTDAVLKLMIEAQVAQASLYGIQSRRDVCDYVSLSFEFGERFDRIPWAAEILSDPWQQKARRLYEAALAVIPDVTETRG